MDQGAQTALSKRPWTAEEDTALLNAVSKYGASRWSMIATQVATGRIGKQCRERWNNHLCPEVKKCEWSEEEDRAIMQGVALMGTRWCEIIKAPELSGRTDNSIKNRWFALDRKRKAKQAGTSRTGPRKAAEPAEIELVPPRSDANIVAIATELAFTTDEYERDCLIEKLTAALRLKEEEDKTKALAERVAATPGAVSDVLSAEELVDAPHDLFEMALQPEQQLGQTALTSGVASEQELASIAPEQQQLASIAISLSESLCLPMAKPAGRRLGCSAGASDGASDGEDASEDTSVQGDERGSLSGSHSGGSVGGSLGDEGAMPELLGEDHLSSSSPESSPRSSPTHSPTSSPAIVPAPAARHLLALDVPLVRRAAATDDEPMASDAPLPADEPTPAWGRKPGGAPAIPTSPLTGAAGASPRRAALSEVSAACLGGRHAYRAFLAPLSLPAAEAAELDSPKRLRTTPGGGYARVGSPLGGLGSAPRRVERTPSRLGRSPSLASAGSAADDAAFAAPSLPEALSSLPVASAAGWGTRAATGTKEPSVAALAKGAAASPCSAMAALPKQAARAALVGLPSSDDVSEAISEAISEDRIRLADFRDLLGEELDLSDELLALEGGSARVRVAGGECGTEEPVSASSQRKRCLA